MAVVVNGIARNVHSDSGLVDAPQSQTGGVLCRPIDRQTSHEEWNRGVSDPPSEAFGPPTGLRGGSLTPRFRAQFGLQNLAQHPADPWSVVAAH